MTLLFRKATSCYWVAVHLCRHFDVLIWHNSPFLKHFISLLSRNWCVLYFLISGFLFIVCRIVDCCLFWLPRKFSCACNTSITRVSVFGRRCVSDRCGNASELTVLCGQLKWFCLRNIQELFHIVFTSMKLFQCLHVFAIRARISKCKAVLLSPIVSRVQDDAIKESQRLNDAA